MTNKNTDSWDGFCGANFLKTLHVKDELDPFVCVGADINEEDEDEDIRPRLTFEKDKENYLFDLNVTNSTYCKNNGIINPRSLIGKKIFFKKVLVVSPKTKKEVESLRICKID